MLIPFDSFSTLFIGASSSTEGQSFFLGVAVHLIDGSAKFAYVAVGGHDDGAQLVPPPADRVVLLSAGHHDELVDVGAALADHDLVDVTQDQLHLVHVARSTHLQRRELAVYVDLYAVALVEHHL